MIAALLLLTGCAGMLRSDPLDVSMVEREVEAKYSEEIGIVVDVTCPEGVEWETGGEFRCQLTSDDFAGTLVTVYMETDDREWSWQVG